MTKQFKPTREQRAVVTALSACGTRRQLIAERIGCDQKTLTKHFKKELTEGSADANARVAATLYQKALAGDTISCIFWLKTRAGWRETSRLEMDVRRGPDAVPVLSDLRDTIRFVMPDGSLKQLGDPEVEQAKRNRVTKTLIDFDGRSVASQKPGALSQAVTEALASGQDFVIKGEDFVEAAPVEEPAPPIEPAPRPLPTILLSTGPHVIDGQTIEVPGPAGEHVTFPLTPGRHVVDDKQTFVHDLVKGVVVGGGVADDPTDGRGRRRLGRE